MNQAQMATLLGVSDTTVSRICSGERRPSIDLILRIRTTLGWSMDSQADALRESTTRYGHEFRARVERRRIPRGHNLHRDDVMNRRCNGCERLERLCGCVASLVDAT